jgi:hypothetical protein
MSIKSELEKLISLRDRGDLSQAEFEKAEHMLLSDDSSETPSSQKVTQAVGRRATGIPGLGLAAGVFAGNLLGISIASGDLQKGFMVGAIAAVLVIVYSLAARAFRSQ